MVSLIIGMFLSTVTLAQDSVTTSVSNADYLRWLADRDELWNKELFRLEVSGDPSAPELFDLHKAIETQKAILKGGSDTQTPRARKVLHNLVMSLEQGLESALSESAPPDKFYSRL